MTLFVTCGPALEPLLIEELTEMGIKNIKIGYRGVFVENWDWNHIYQINYASRLASRVLLPLSRFRCADRNDLYEGALKINWLPFLKGQATFAIDANVHQQPQLRNSLYAAQVLKDAICDQMRDSTGRRPSVDVQNPDVQLNLYIQKNTAVISFDTSGIPLHKRGYRQESVEAPMQETLAAAILRLSQYNAEHVLLDPCCGSGTLLIEAALIASQTPPGYLRRTWGFMTHPAYEPQEWLRVRNRLDQMRRPIPPQHLFGVDVSKNAVRACQINLKAAGFQKDVEVMQYDFRDLKPTILPQVIITNPPHGKRLSEETVLYPLYRALGDFMKNHMKKPAKGFIFTSNLNLTKEVGLTAKKRYVLNQGGDEARLLEYDIY